jgi:hypothetical protein
VLARVRSWVPASGTCHVFFARSKLWRLYAERSFDLWVGGFYQYVVKDLRLSVYV